MSDPHTLKLTLQDGEPIIERGEFCPEDTGFLDQLMIRRRYITLGKGNAYMTYTFPKEERSFVDELAKRGYDLNTLEISFTMKEGSQPPYVSTDPEPGLLVMGYGLDADEGIADYVGSYGAEGASKEDLNLTFSTLLMMTAFDWDDEAGCVTEKQSIIFAAERLGYDETSLRLRVRQMAPAPSITP